MTQHTHAKVVLVFPLHFRHCQQAVDQVFTPAGMCVTRRRLILDDVAALEPPGAVHRRKPATQVTHESEHTPDDGGAYFAHFPWSSAEAREHLADELPVLPFFVFDLLDSPALIRVADRVPVAAIRVSGGQFA